MTANFQKSLLLRLTQLPFAPSSLSLRCQNLSKNWLHASDWTWGTHLPMSSLYVQVTITGMQCDHNTSVSHVAKPQTWCQGECQGERWGSPTLALCPFSLCEPLGEKKKPHKYLNSLISKKKGLHLPAADGLLGKVTRARSTPRGIWSEAARNRLKLFQPCPLLEAWHDQNYFPAPHSVLP